MPAPVPHQHLLDRKKTLEDKLTRLKGKEINAAQTDGDGRQEEAIARTEGFLRQINVEIENAEKINAAAKDKKK